MVLGVQRVPMLTPWMSQSLQRVMVPASARGQLQVRTRHVLLARCHAFQVRTRHVLLARCHAFRFLASVSSVPASV